MLEFSCATHRMQTEQHGVRHDRYVYVIVLLARKMLADSTRSFFLRQEKHGTCDGLLKPKFLILFQ